MVLFFTSIGADISYNDVYCSENLIGKIGDNLHIVKSAEHVNLTNITGDDVCITALCKEENLEKTNQEIIQVLENSAEDYGDLEGVKNEKVDAGEGVSYACIPVKDGFIPDCIVMHFDTYGGEGFVYDVAEAVLSAASGMSGVTSVSNLNVEETFISGVGYSGEGTDDPVVLVGVNDLESVGVVASAMVGAALGCKNTYFVNYGANCDVMPGSVIFSVSLYLNGNIIDFSVPFENRAKILK